MLVRPARLAALLLLVIGLGGAAALLGAGSPVRRASVAIPRGVRRGLGHFARPQRPCESESVGKPWRGSLRCAQPLSPYGRLALHSSSAYGTAQTLAALRKASDALEDQDPDGPPIDVFDLSGPGGGRSAYHLSHQSGRDVDLGYLYLDGFRPANWNAPAPLDEFDAARTWMLLEALIRTGEVQRVFIDYELQAPLYAEAMKTQSRWAALLFQYPRGPSEPHGLIRHFRNHRSHLHVRFRCPPGSHACRG